MYTEGCRFGLYEVSEKTESQSAYLCPKQPDDEAQFAQKRIYWNNRMCDIAVSPA